MRMTERRVPRSSSAWLGTLIVQTLPGRVITRWLPLDLATAHPALSSARTASLPLILGSGGMP